MKKWFRGFMSINVLIFSISYTTKGGRFTI